MDFFDELIGPLHAPDNLFTHLSIAASDHQDFLSPFHDHPTFASAHRFVDHPLPNCPPSLPDLAAHVDCQPYRKRSCHSPPLRGAAAAPDQIGGQHHVAPSRLFNAAATQGKSRAESLRRKRMSKLFSKLEVLLPQDDIPKFDRCSLIDASIRYIRSLERSIAEGSHRNTADTAMRHQNLENSADGSTNDGKPSCPVSGNSSTTVQMCDCAQQLVVAVRADLAHAFVNAVSCNTDPVTFSRVLSVLQDHSLEILSATFSRCEETVRYSVYAKVPDTIKLCDQLLRDKIYNLIASMPSEVRNTT